MYALNSDEKKSKQKQIFWRNETSWTGGLSITYNVHRTFVVEKYWKCLKGIHDCSHHLINSCCLYYWSNRECSRLFCCRIFWIQVTVWIWKSIGFYWKTKHVSDWSKKIKIIIKHQRIHTRNVDIICFNYAYCVMEMKLGESSHMRTKINQSSED